MKARKGLRQATAPLGMAGGALAVCCTIHLIILAGGIGAAAGVLGGWLRSPYVMVTGFALTVLMLAVVVIRRTRPAAAESCCAPEPAAPHELTTTSQDG